MTAGLTRRCRAPSREEPDGKGMQPYLHKEVFIMSRTASTSMSSARAPDPSPDFVCSETLRRLLCRLHEDGPGAWVHDAVATELMQYTRDKYAALAMKHRLDPWEAVSAAFRVMVTPAAREARDPWAVVTHAVQIACSIEERSQGLLCSAHQARRSRFGDFHDPERFSDRDRPVTDYHPVTTIGGDFGEVDAVEAEPAPTPIRGAVEEAVSLLILLGWPSVTGRAAVELVCDALTRTGTRQAAYSTLRSDGQAPVLLGIPGPAWTSFLRALLGNPEPVHAATPTACGILVRLLTGETLPTLLTDDALVDTLAFTSTAGVGR